MSIPLISVIVPCRPQELVDSVKKIGAIANSLADDCRSLMEFIFSVDGELSRKHRSAAEQSLVSFRLSIIENARSGHIGAVRNRAATAALGRWLYFIDADCSVAPSTFSHILCTKWNTKIIVGDTKFVANSWIGKLEAEMRSYRYCQEKHAYCPNLLIDKEVFFSLGCFDESFAYGSDGEFSERAIRSGKGIVKDSLLVVCHHCDDSIVGTIRRWFSYGEGRHRRYVKLGIPMSGRSYFPLTHGMFNRTALRLYVFSHNIVRGLGVVRAMFKIGF